MLQPNGYSAEAVELQKWVGTQWVTSQQLTGMGSDTWNRRPMPIGSMVRIANTYPLEASWDISELRLFTQEHCKDQMDSTEHLGRTWTAPGHHLDITWTAPEQHLDSALHRGWLLKVIGRSEVLGCRHTS